MIPGHALMSNVRYLGPGRADREVHLPVPQLVAFTALNEVYGREIHLADQWLTCCGLAGHHHPPGSDRHTRAFGARLTF